MVTLNYQLYGSQGFNLRLRLYQAGESKFISVTRFLRGAIKRQHWNQKKQYFVNSCPFSEENNEFLTKFRKKYEDLAIGWTGSIQGLILAVEGAPNEEDSNPTIRKFIHQIVDNLMENRHPDGTIKGTYEEYLKFEDRFQEFCEYRHIKYDTLKLSDIHPALINDLFRWINNARQGKGMRYVSKTFHSIIAKADKKGLMDLEKFEKCDWFKNNGASSQKNNSLTEAQCKKFATMNLDKVCDSPKNELYRDFCLFLLYTGQSPCDAITMKYSDIKNIEGVDHFVFKRRKISHKQSVPCAVPINPAMDKIMLRWKSESKDGYIFPIRSCKKLKTQKTNNGDIKHFTAYLNVWLKKVGKELGCKFPLHSYTFRHTAITRYISKGIPISYVANMMGTSVANCEKIYYDNHKDIASRNKVLAAVRI